MAGGGRTNGNGTKSSALAISNRAATNAPTINNFRISNNYPKPDAPPSLEILEIVIRIA
jgi:hypothetical protein